MDHEYTGVKHKVCGGRIIVKDWGGDASPEYRYEPFCEKCSAHHGSRESVFAAKMLAKNFPPAKEQ